MLNVIDEFSRECLGTIPQRRFRSDDVLAVLADVFIEHGPTGSQYAAYAKEAKE